MNTDEHGFDLLIESVLGEVFEVSLMLDAAKYAGHSLRAGHATSAAIAGASERSIMNQTGHRSVQMVRRYIRDGSLFRENSAGKLGL
jgi:integrase